MRRTYKKSKANQGVLMKVLIGVLIGDFRGKTRWPPAGTCNEFLGWGPFVCQEELVLLNALINRHLLVIGLKC